jgi:hypothetical protein
MVMGWWNWDSWPRADEWAAFWAFATFLVAATAAAVALRQFRAYISEMEERARPYLVVDFEFRSVLLYVTLENISSTPATSVRLTSVPMLRSTMEDRDKAIAGILDGTFVIPQIAPGRKMRWLIDRTPDLFADKDIPHRVIVTAEYTDPRAVGKRAPYLEPFVLDLDQYSEASGEQDYDSKNWNIANRNEARVEAMKGSLASVASSLDTLLENKGAANGLRRREFRNTRRHRRQAGRTL